MRRRQIFDIFLIGTLCISLFFSTRFPLRGAESPEKKEELAIYQKGRKKIYSGEWRLAVQDFKEIVGKFSKGRYIEDSFYWLGYSLNKLSKNSGNFEKQLALQQEAVLNLETLIKRFPVGKWADDAKLLIIDIAEDLAGKGMNRYREYIRKSAVEEQDRDIRMAAIDSLLRTDKEKAFPILEEIIRGGEDTKLKERAIFVLSQIRDPRVVSIFADTALKDGNIKVREQSIFWLGQLRRTRSREALRKIYETLENEELKTKIIFSIFQDDSSESIRMLMELYKKEKKMKLKKAIIFHMGMSKQKEAENFIKKILND